MNYFELNLDGLVGPTHHYAGLAPGNLASTQHAFSQANPKAAALEGLEKMQLLHQLGLKQAIWPPHFRPNAQLLYNMGFTGTLNQQIAKVARQAPFLLTACFSASNMWAANAATISPSLDTADNRVHFTAANLVSHLHRAQEANVSHNLLKTLFSHEDYFVHHPVLPASLTTCDEGAANHSRLCHTHHQAGLHFFVYGLRQTAQPVSTQRPHQYPARQSYEASFAIAKAHQLDLNQVIFAQQRPDAIDGGVFHNDVIAVANESVLLVHEHAFVAQKKVLSALQQKLPALNIIEIKNTELSVSQAVATYLFNSQLVTLPNREMALIAPIECQKHPKTQTLIQTIIADNTNPITQVYYLNLKQSMFNGGGPACLRLRVLLNEAELAHMHQGILFNDALFHQLKAWVNRYYREQLSLSDLTDPDLVQEVMTAFDALTTILKLQSIYPFQK